MYQGTQDRASRELGLLPVTETLAFIALNLLGSLSKSNLCQDHVLVITDRFTKFTRELPLKTITSQAVTDAFLTHWANA